MSDQSSQRLEQDGFSITPHVALLGALAIYGFTESLVFAALFVAGLFFASGIAIIYSATTGKRA